MFKNLPLSILLLVILMAACTPAPVIPARVEPPAVPSPSGQPLFSTPTAPQPSRQPPSGTPPMSATATSTLPAGDDSVVDPVSVLFSVDYGREGRAFEHAFIAPYGKALVVILEGGLVQIIHLEEEMDATLRLPFDFLFQENAVSVQPDRILFAEYSMEGNGNITIWQVIPGNEAVMVAAISEMDAFVTSLAFSPDGGTLAVGFNLGEIRLYRTRDGARLHIIKAFNDFVMSMAYSQDGRYIIADSLSFDPNTYVFDAKNGNKLATLSTESWEPGQVSFSVDGRLAAATASDGTYIFTTGDWQRTGAVIAGVWEGTFTCDGRGFMLARGGQVDIYSLSDGLYVETLDGGPFYCLADGWMVAIVLDYENNILTLRHVNGLEQTGIEP